MRVLLVEDDYIDAEPIAEEIRVRLGASIDVLRTEREFVERFQDIASNPPDIVIVDVMLPWDHPRPDLVEDSVPEDVSEGGFYTAGLRCISRLASDPRTSSLPYIIYTGLDQNNFSQYIVCTKSESLDPLIAAIREKLDLSHRSR